MGFANLHLHTHFSDGSIGPADLAKRLVAETDLEYFALTDHDTLSAIEPFYRALNRLGSTVGDDKKHFIPGIELSLVDEQSGSTIHLLGYFPRMNGNNVSAELTRIDAVLGDFCRYRAENRAAKDVDARIIRAFELNLDGIADRFDGPGTVIHRLQKRAGRMNRKRFDEAEKTDDVIKYPIPATYQVIIDNWQRLLPGSSRKKAALYVLRPNPSRKKRLARIYQDEGMKGATAAALAEKHQGSLVFFRVPSVLKEMDVFSGLKLLQSAGAVTVLAHPAVDHVRVSYEEFDGTILYPLMDSGLDGIEVFYPYDRSYRAEAVTHYHDIARKSGLLVSGGTDFHGDGRTGLTDVHLDIENAQKIIESGYGK